MKRFQSATAKMRRAQLLRSNAKPLVMLPPIEPRASQVETPADHPLWQFFSNQSFMRKVADLEDLGVAWSIPQLRRKNFADLHTLWYVSLKELNKVNREMRLLALYENRPSQDTRRYAADENKFTELAEQIKTTMWRIRHVLAERYHGWKQVSSESHLTSPDSEHVAQFRNQFLTADANADSQVNSMLERFQYAFFGINPLLDGNFPDPKVCQGLFVVAQLKLERYASEQTEFKTVNDIREAYTLFACEGSPEGVAEALETVRTIRASSEPVPPSAELEVLAELMLAAQS